MSGENLEMDKYLFHQGTHYTAYDFLGAHIHGDEVRFITWAPNAKHVQLACDVNDYTGEGFDFERLGDQGLWILTTPRLQAGDRYKYKIYFGDTYHLKSDPYGFYHEKRPATASIIDEDDFKFTDSEWMDRRRRLNVYESPISIYEMHLGTWMKHPVGNTENKTVDEITDEAHYSYREVADALIPYLKEMGYTHVEFLPLTEHPFDLSWGYQVTGYFSATSRYGRPEELKDLINKLHNANIGVIMDFVPAHFCKDAHGLRLFDGTPTYEHPDEEIAEKREWGTLTFDYARPEVQSFLISAAMYWIREFHIDGLRIDAVHSMIDLNFEKRDENRKIFNEEGTEDNIAGIELLKKLNTVAFEYDETLLMMAEDSSDTPMVTSPVHTGGLGFNFKWDLGWMHDRLDFMEEEFHTREYNHNKLTFSMAYKYNENYLLPLSHDEVVHGKKSIVDKMAGDQWQQFAQTRLLYGNQMSEPGKQLLFMGQEFGMYHEWKDKEQLDWHLLDYPLHYDLKRYVADLNRLYQEYPEFHRSDYQPEGFRWLLVDDSSHSILSYARKSGDSFKVCVFNYRPEVYHDFKIPVPEPGVYREIFNSDSEDYSGSGVVSSGRHFTTDEGYIRESQYIQISVAPLAFQVFDLEDNKNGRKKYD
ncbi:1,4-alpha-glucan branching protein GlgB [Salinicoccus sp. ID82-1]|uniref:1,4-alpha-glucan branching protein GlgB n=1 Tax=Salinicoccus sp. ID82-1 TaxID=2820269 RepID=UPI001F02B80F|nr:1,4-alpha-glucan branching protein GlgB [Salinicoccus sp. ID82-1]